MSLKKKVVVDKIEIVANGLVQVRTVAQVFEGGVLLSSSLHRHVVAPGDDYSGEDARVQAICAAMHTPEVIAAYRASLAENPSF